MAPGSNLINVIVLVVIVVFLVYSGYNTSKLVEPPKESFLDWSMYNPAIVDGKYPVIGTTPVYPPLVDLTRLGYDNARDRVENPLRYPYRSVDFYDNGWYPNMDLPEQVIGCGGRNTPCLGGTQTPILNVFPPINISETNIAPVNIQSRGVAGVPQQVGVLYKIFGGLNEIYPLFGRRKFQNSDTWQYYTIIGNTNYPVKVPVLTSKRSNNELGTNDVVRIAGNSAKFRATIYDQDFPQYIPYT